MFIISFPECITCFGHIGFHFFFKKCQSKLTYTETSIYRNLHTHIPISTFIYPKTQICTHTHTHTHLHIISMIVLANVSGK